MFGRLSREATQTTEGVDVSRRGFLGRLARGAAVAVAAAAAALGPPTASRAGGTCCHYSCYPASSFTKQGPCHHISGCIGSEFAC
jgi:hypothetical protein